MQNLIISIPKPCHEDWGKMSVEERGRFCGKCCKTVVDFSNKTTSEIQQYVSTHKDEKLCGHFSNHQLNQPVTIQLPVPASYRISSPLQLFAVALLITFGTSLFACTTPQGNTVGLIQFTAVDTPATIIPRALDILPVVGGISFYEIPAEAENHIKGDTIVTPGLKGKIAIEPDTLFKTLPEIEIEASTVPLVSCGMTGLLAVERNETNASGTPDTEGVTLIENKAGEITATPDDFNTLIYPNPTDGLLHIDIHLEKEEFAEVDLYDLAGRYVSSLLTKQILRPGRNKFELNISGNSPGIYLLKTVIGNKSKTEKVVLEKR